MTASPQVLSDFAARVAGGESGEALAQHLEAHQGPWEACGVSPRMIACLTRALATGVADEAVAEFGRMRDFPVGFFVGPLRIGGEFPFSPGLLLMVRNPSGRARAAEVARHVRVLGERLFGEPLWLEGPPLELYDLALATGAWTEGDAGTLLQTPFDLGGWQDLSRQALTPRKILFLNALRVRIRAVDAPASHACVRIDGRPFPWAEATPEALDGAIALWRSLRELVQENGPLRVFRSRTQAPRPNPRRSEVERMRADMTVFLLLGGSEDLFGEAAGLARELLLVDHLVWATRRGTGNLLGESPLWLSHVLQAGAAYVTPSGALELDAEKLTVCTHRLLERIYDAESEAASARPDAAAELLTRLDDGLFSPVPEKLGFTPDVLPYLNALKRWPQRPRLADWRLG